MGRTYLEGDVLTAADLNASLQEAVNTNGYFVFSGVVGSPLLPYVDPISGLTVTPNPMTGEHIHNAPLTANGTFIVNTNPSHFYSNTNFYNNIYIHSGNVVVDSGSLNVTGNINDLIGNVRKVPRDSSKPNGYVVTSTDAGKFIYATGDVYIPANIFNVGDNVTIYNSTGSAISVKQAGGTMYIAGIGSTGDRTLDTKGLATILCVDTNVYAITGAGLN